MVSKRRPGLKKGPARTASATDEVLVARLLQVAERWRGGRYVGGVEACARALAGAGADLDAQCRALGAVKDALKQRRVRCALAEGCACCAGGGAGAPCAAYGEVGALALSVTACPALCKSVRRNASVVLALVLECAAPGPLSALLDEVVAGLALGPAPEQCATTLSLLVCGESAATREAVLRRVRPDTLLAALVDRALQPAAALTLADVAGAAEERPVEGPAAAPGASMIDLDDCAARLEGSMEFLIELLDLLQLDQERRLDGSGSPSMMSESEEAAALAALARLRRDTLEPLLSDRAVGSFLSFKALRTHVCVALVRMTKLACRLGAPGGAQRFRSAAAPLVGLEDSAAEAPPPPLLLRLPLGPAQGGGAEWPAPVRAALLNQALGSLPSESLFLPLDAGVGPQRAVAPAASAYFVGVAWARLREVSERNLADEAVQAGALQGLVLICRALCAALGLGSSPSSRDAAWSFWVRGQGRSLLQEAVDYVLGNWGQGARKTRYYLEPLLVATRETLDMVRTELSSRWPELPGLAEEAAALAGSHRAFVAALTHQVAAAAAAHSGQGRSSDLKAALTMLGSVARRDGLERVLDAEPHLFHRLIGCLAGPGAGFRPVVAAFVDLARAAEAGGKRELWLMPLARALVSSAGAAAAAAADDDAAGGGGGGESGEQGEALREVVARELLPELARQFDVDAAAILAVFRNTAGLRERITVLSVFQTAGSSEIEVAPDGNAAAASSAPQGKLRVSSSDVEAALLHPDPRLRVQALELLLPARKRLVMPSRAQLDLAQRFFAAAPTFPHAKFKDRVLRRTQMLLETIRSALGTPRVLAEAPREDARAAVAFVHWFLQRCVAGAYPQAPLDRCAFALDLLRAALAALTVPDSEPREQLLEQPPPQPPPLRQQQQQQQGPQPRPDSGARRQLLAAADLAAEQLGAGPLLLPLLPAGGRAAADRVLALVNTLMDPFELAHAGAFAVLVALPGPLAGLQSRAQVSRLVAWAAQVLLKGARSRDADAGANLIRLVHAKYVRALGWAIDVPESSAPQWATAFPGVEVDGRAGALTTARALREAVDDALLELCCDQALKCESAERAYNVGAVAVSAGGAILATGYSRELPGNTHAEETALIKIGVRAKRDTAAAEAEVSAEHIVDDESGESDAEETEVDYREAWRDHPEASSGPSVSGPPATPTLPPALEDDSEGDIARGEAVGCTMYTSMEPCSKRLSGRRGCTSRCLAARVARVVVGVREPDNFVTCTGDAELRAAGVRVDYTRSASLRGRCMRPNAFLFPGADFGAPEDEQQRSRRRKAAEAAAQGRGLPPAQASQHFVWQLVGLLQAKVAASGASPESLEHLSGTLRALSYCFSDTLTLDREWRPLVSELVELLLSAMDEARAVIGTSGRWSAGGQDAEADEGEEHEPGGPDADPFGVSSTVEVDCRGHLVVAGPVQGIDGDGQSASNSFARRKVMSCWLAIRGGSELLMNLVRKSPLQVRRSPDSDDDLWVLSYAQVERIGGWMLDALASLKHIGAIGVVAVALQGVSSRLLELRRGETSQAQLQAPQHQQGAKHLLDLPRSWLQSLLDRLAGGSQSFVLRKSIGFASSFLALARSEPPQHNAALLGEMMRALVAAAAGGADDDTQPQEQLQDQSSERRQQLACQVHAMNIIKVIVEDSNLQGELELGTLSEVLVLSARGFTSTLWQVRNSAMMIFAKAVRRVVGSEFSQGHASGVGARRTVAFVFGRLPGLRGAVLRDLGSNVDVCIYPWLLLLSRLEPRFLRGGARAFLGLGEGEIRDADADDAGDEQHDSAVADFVPLLAQCCVLQPQALIRAMAARALASIIPNSTLRPTLLAAIAALQETSAAQRIDHNRLHGLLLEIKELLSAIYNRRIAEDLFQQSRSDAALAGALNAALAEIESALAPALAAALDAAHPAARVVHDAAWEVVEAWVSVAAVRAAPAARATPAALTLSPELEALVAAGAASGNLKAVALSCAHLGPGARAAALGSGDVLLRLAAMRALRTAVGQRWADTGGSESAHAVASELIRVSLDEVAAAAATAAAAAAGSAVMPGGAHKALYYYPPELQERLGLLSDALAALGSGATPKLLPGAGKLFAPLLQLLDRTDSEHTVGCVLLVLARLVAIGAATESERSGAAIRMLRAARPTSTTALRAVSITALRCSGELEGTSSHPSAWVALVLLAQDENDEVRADAVALANAVVPQLAAAPAPRCEALALTALVQHAARACAGAAAWEAYVEDRLAPRLAPTLRECLRHGAHDFGLLQTELFDAEPDNVYSEPLEEARLLLEAQLRPAPLPAWDNEQGGRGGEAQRQGVVAALRRAAADTLWPGGLTFHPALFRALLLFLAARRSAGDTDALRAVRRALRAGPRREQHPRIRALLTTPRSDAPPRLLVALPSL